MSSSNTDLAIFKNILFFTTVIVTVPIMCFFGVKFLLFNLLYGTDSVSANVCSAIVAVVVLHIAVGTFIYRAYKEDTKPEPVKPVKMD